MEPTPPPARPERDHQRGRIAPILATLGKVLLGSGILLAVMGLTIMKEPSTGASTAEGVAPTTMVVATTAAAPAPTSTTSTETTVPPSPYEQAASTGGYLAVSAAVDPVRIYDTVPPGSQLIVSWPRGGTRQNGSTFLVTAEATAPDGTQWYQVMMPKRPNGTLGWVRASEVTTVPLTHSIHVDISERSLDLYESGAKKATYEVAVGRPKTPTTPGDFYITYRVKPVQEMYGALIMMINSFSEDLPDWPGGGQAAIHGTNDDVTIGANVSNGCIRMHNEDLLELAASTPVGTPVFVQE